MSQPWTEVRVKSAVGTCCGVVADVDGVLTLAVKPTPDAEWVERPVAGENRIADGCTTYHVFAGPAAPEPLAGVVTGEVGVITFAPGLAQLTIVPTAGEPVQVTCRDGDPNSRLTSKFTWNGAPVPPTPAGLRSLIASLWGCDGTVFFKAHMLWSSYIPCVSVDFTAEGPS